MGEADDGWVVETVNDSQGFRTSLKATAPAHRLASGQDLLVFDNATFGRVMMLDGGIQITTADEFIYSEIMAHVPLMAHGSAMRVAIVGGGDGGIAREVLRHPVADVTLVEIDPAVVDFARHEFPQIVDGAFDDARLRVVFADGADFMAGAGEPFDVIIVDSPDPIGAGATLFTPTFYGNCARRLTAGGILVTQSGMPFLAAAWLTDHSATLRHAVGSARFFLSSVPTYTGGSMAHGFATCVPFDQPDEETLAGRQASLGFATRYWSPAVHRAAFALPPYIAALVGDS